MADFTNTPTAPHKEQAREPSGLFDTVRDGQVTMLGGLLLMNTPMQADKTANALILMLGTHADCHTQPNITVHELVGLKKK